jgi:hypothetical protein
MHYLGTNRNAEGESTCLVQTCPAGCLRMYSHIVHTKENIHQINKHTPLHEQTYTIT